ncbi:hypothetical protein NDU88_009436 [Pleurodeles waltl]|uniref:Uncharacterized protein n=1 Tax=Pleurodeles waltl TaxID=8319 RepID=A0AAV7QVA2_PLEWA|nr:hypothetical protein NDU88_009436 [Pleurodeles waltl]
MRSHKARNLGGALVGQRSQLKKSLVQSALEATIEQWDGEVDWSVCICKMTHPTESGRFFIVFVIIAYATASSGIAEQ